MKVIISYLIALFLMVGVLRFSSDIEDMRLNLKGEVVEIAAPTLMEGVNSSNLTTNRKNSATRECSQEEQKGLENSERKVNRATSCEVWLGRNNDIYEIN